jgi:hypothetical protein
MIHEYRTYTIHPAQLRRYLQLAQTKVQPIRQDKYGRLVGFWYSEFGTLNQVHHIWEYSSLDRRQEDRRALFQQRDWMEQFISSAWPTMQIQEVRFMIPQADLASPPHRSAFYEARIYRTAVGAFRSLADLVAERPLAAGATRIAHWTCETPQPNEVCELIAYPSFEARLSDASETPPQQAWLERAAAGLQLASATLLLPISISPLR